MFGRTHAQKSLIVGAGLALAVGGFTLLMIFRGGGEKSLARPERQGVAADICAPSAKAKAEGAMARGLISDAGLRHDGLHLAISSRAWAAMSFAERDALIGAVDCAVAGPNYLKGIVVETPAGLALRKYTARDLFEARQLQAQR